MQIFNNFSGWGSSATWQHATNAAAATAAAAAARSSTTPPNATTTNNATTSTRRRTSSSRSWRPKDCQGTPARSPWCSTSTSRAEGGYLREIPMVARKTQDPQEARIKTKFKIFKINNSLIGRNCLNSNYIFLKCVYSTSKNNK